MKTVLRALTVLALLVLSAPLASAQTATLSGRITDSAGDPIDGVTVRIEGTSMRGTTDANGAYQINGVPPGTHTLRVGIIGYRPGSRVVTPCGAAVEASFTTGATPVRIPCHRSGVGSRCRTTARTSGVR